MLSAKSDTPSAPCPALQKAANVKILLVSTQIKFHITMIYTWCNTCHACVVDLELSSRIGSEEYSSLGIIISYLTTPLYKCMYCMNWAAGTLLKGPCMLVVYLWMWWVVVNWWWLSLAPTPIVPTPVSVSATNPITIVNMDNSHDKCCEVITHANVNWHPEVIA